MNLPQDEPGKVRLPPSGAGGNHFYSLPQLPSPALPDLGRCLSQENKRTPWGRAFRVGTGDMQRGGYLGSEERRVRSPSAPDGSPASTCRGGAFLELCDRVPSLASPDSMPSSRRHAGLSMAPSPTPLSHLLHHLLERTGPPHPEPLLLQLLPVVLTPAATSPLLTSWPRLLHPYNCRSMPGYSVISMPGYSVISVPGYSVRTRKAAFQASHSSGVDLQPCCSLTVRPEQTFCLPFYLETRQSLPCESENQMDLFTVSGIQ